jgi:hypothetical protein
MQRLIIIGLVLCSAAAVLAQQTYPPLMDFKGSASGSVRRSMAKKLDDLPNVVTDFGAKCDGSTDDSGAFASAAASTRRVTIPPGNCNLGTTGVAFSNGTTFVGAGEQSTTLTYSGTGCAITRDGVQGTYLGHMKVVTTGNGAGVRGLCEKASGGTTNEFNTIEDVYFIQNNATARIAGQIGLLLSVTGATGVYWNKYKKVEFNRWDTSIELDGNGTNQPNSHEFDVISAAANVPMYLQRANDNGIRIRCTTSDGTLVAGTQVCLTVGDGVNPSIGNIAVVFSDQGATGKSVALAANSSKNHVIDDNESSIASTDAGANNNLISIGLVCCANIYRHRLDSVQVTGRATVSGIFTLGSAFSVAKGVHVANANYTSTSGDYFVGFNSLTAARTLTLNSTLAGEHLIVADEDGSATAVKTITAAAPAGGTIDGAATKDIITSARGKAFLYAWSSDGKSWISIPSP